MSAGRWSIVVATAAIVACHTIGETQPSGEPVTFFAVAELTKSRSASPQISGGRLAEPKDWPASFYARLGDDYCTSTAVGPRALLTAAHCVRNRTATLMLANVEYRLQCERAPGYTASAKADWALCALDKPLPSLPFEVLSTSASTVKKNDDVTLSGFGCDGTAGTDGVFRIGESRVQKVPSGSNYDIVTSGGAAVCFGDSGGAAYRYLDGTRRVQIAVNSRAGTEAGQSYLSSLAVRPAIDFLHSWSSRNDVFICGVHPGATGCRRS
jgi:hypothetical protein